MNHPISKAESRLLVEVSAARRFAGLNRRRLAKLSRDACNQLGVRRGAVSIHLADDEEMGGLHERFKGRAGPTDVLTFDHRPPRPAGRKGLDGRIDAEIVIGAQVAQREARVRGLAVEAEALLYIVHGLLHCLGEDDRTAASARRMHAREDAVLRALGVGRVFGVPARRAETATMMQGRRRRSRSCTRHATPPAAPGRRSRGPSSA